MGAGGGVGGQGERAPCPAFWAGPSAAGDLVRLWPPPARCQTPFRSRDSQRRPRPARVENHRFTMGHSVPDSEMGRNPPHHPASWPHRLNGHTCDQGHRQALEADLASAMRTGGALALLACGAARERGSACPGVRAGLRRRGLGLRGAGCRGESLRGWRAQKAGGGPGQGQPGTPGPTRPGPHTVKRAPPLPAEIFEAEHQRAREQLPEFTRLIPTGMSSMQKKWTSKALNRNCHVRRESRRQGAE